MKNCTKCKNLKAFHEFNKQNKIKSGYRSMCRNCQKLESKIWVKNNPEKVWNIGIKHKYGITSEEYYKMLESQNGTCKVCPQTVGYGGKKLAIDHCHKTGKVRGLLCTKCNAALGVVEQLDLVIKLQQYLKETS